MPDKPVLELYGHPFSSYTWKAQIALHATGAEHRLMEVRPDEAANNGFVQESHPAGKFPVLKDGEKTIVEATSIVEYLALNYPGGSALLPADPSAAHEVRMIDRVFDNYVMANLQRVVSAFIANPDDPDMGEIAAGKKDLLRAYRWLEAWLAENELPPHISLVTCAAAPSLFYADWIERIPPDCPRLTALRAELLELPEVSRCVEAARPYRGYFPPGAPDRD